MTLEELERSASRGDELPDGLTPPGEYLFLSLRALYASYRSGHIDREQAGNEKKQLMKNHEIFTRRYQAHGDALDMIYEMSPYAADANKNGCEYCRQMMKVFDRRRKKYKEDAQ